MTSKKINNLVKYIAWGSTIATVLAGLVAGGYFLGNFLDSRLGTDPWLKVVLILGGVFLGIGYLVMSLINLGKFDNEQ